MDGLHSVDVCKLQWIEKQLKSRVSEISDSRPLSVFCGTWNVNNKVLSDNCSLSDWLLPAETAMSDVYAIGFQEIVGLNARNVMLDGSKSVERCHYWQEAVLSCLESSGEYYCLLCAKNLVGISLYIYVKQRLVNNCRDVRSNITACGVMGVMGNKGGISVRFDLFDSSFCFVCTHLAASRDNVAGRNSDCRQILERTVFPIPEPSDDGLYDTGLFAPMRPAPRTWRSFSNAENKELVIMDHEYVFWFGDLNYRIDESLLTEDVFALVHKSDIDTLLIKDQLRLEMLQQRVFCGFKEGAIAFHPTYKYIPGTSVYEDRAEKKVRPPAWCDRVLSYAKEENSLQQVQYCSTPSLTPSDHKPVFARFECDGRVIVEAREKTVYQELLRTLDRWENDSIPKVEISSRDLDFGRVQYLVIF